MTHRAAMDTPLVSVFLSRSIPFRSACACHVCNENLSLHILVMYACNVLNSQQPKGAICLGVQALFAKVVLSMRASKHRDRDFLAIRQKHFPHKQHVCARAPHLCSALLA